MLLAAESAESRGKMGRKGRGGKRKSREGWEEEIAESRGKRRGKCCDPYFAAGGDGVFDWSKAALAFAAAADAFS